MHVRDVLGTSRARGRDDDKEASSTRPPHALEVTSDDTMNTSASAEQSSSLLGRIRRLEREDASAEHRQLVITQLAQTLARDARDLRHDRKAVPVRPINDRSAGIRQR